MRMSMRRSTRLTIGFSNKLESHAHAIALHYMYYNSCRIHKNLRCIRARAAAGIIEAVGDGGYSCLAIESGGEGKRPLQVENMKRETGHSSVRFPVFEMCSAIR